MPITRIELCIDGLDVSVREALLEVFWEELKISPGMVTADGNIELALAQCGEPPADAPVIRIGSMPYIQVTPERLRTLLRRRGTR
ncbi:NAD(P)H-dependent oxidoreductase subunit E [Deinococcus sonorensis]|uniref:NAD(P)H-dependent oxidoreductase subunit E n=2 Tax=Deinococcus sonorensis TaxID=309891 RepID=A0AAU7UA26_9DEIO